jgi:hypothetical protein
MFCRVPGQLLDLLLVRISVHGNASEGDLPLITTPYLKGWLVPSSCGVHFVMPASPVGAVIVRPGQRLLEAEKWDPAATR